MGEEKELPDTSGLWVGLGSVVRDNESDVTRCIVMADLPGIGRPVFALFRARSHNIRQSRFHMAVKTLYVPLICTQKRRTTWNLPSNRSSGTFWGQSEAEV